MRQAALTIAWLAVCAAVAPRPAAAQSPGIERLTLAAALERAVAANPTIAAARLQRPVDVAGIGVARERPNPEIAYEFARETPRHAVGATLPLEFGGKRQARIDVANATIGVS